MDMRGAYIVEYLGNDSLLYGREGRARRSYRHDDYRSGEFMAWVFVPDEPLDGEEGEKYFCEEAELEFYGLADD